MEALTTLVTHSLDSVRDFQAEIETFAYQETNIRKDLIIEVDIGMGVYKDDRGVKIRLAAYYLLDALYERCEDFDTNRLTTVIA